MSEHPNATRARVGFERFVQGDLPALLDLFADDAVWHVPGSMSLSGAHRGHEAIIAFLRGTAELTGGTYRVELVWTVADDDHLVAVYRALGSRPDGRSLDIEQALLVELERGRWKVVRAQPLDEAAFDAFWNGHGEADLRMLVEEQAALRRVAVAVATESTAERVFDVVAEEVARLLGADAASLVSLGPRPGEGVIVGTWSEPGVPIPGDGTVIAIARGSAIDRVARTGAPARLATDDPGVPPELHARLVALGVTSLVAAPIVVSGEIWGALVVSVTRDLQLAPNTEERIGQFAGLVAVAIANAQAREALSTLAEEQAALSRVAVAVATEERPEQLFSVVSEEIGRLFGADAGAVVRYADDQDGAVIVGFWQRVGEIDVPLGVRLPFQGGAIARVAQTGRTARIDLEAEPSDLREHMRAARVSSGVAAPIVVSGRLWGATSISNGEGRGSFPPDVEARLEKFTSLVAVALANAEAREQLTASRARIVQAADAERRRLERNLHDGAQQRLVSLALHLRIAESRLLDDPEAAAELLAEAGDELALGLEELRELARGIHPAILTDHGLAPAVEALAARATVPVGVRGLLTERLSEPIEAAAYYVVSESLANVAKYASAHHARVDLACDDGLLVVEVSDDGVGGADPGRGSGLRGLSDRIDALGGRLQVSSEQGRGTTVRAELPLRVGA